MKNVFKRSILKALRDVGITVGTAAATVALVTVSQPEVFAPIIATVGGPVGALLAVAIPIAAKAGLDAIKHRDKAE